VAAGGEPVDHHVPGVLRDVARARVIGGERMPVGDEEQARILGLQPHPVLEHAVVVPEVQASRRRHAVYNARFVHASYLPTTVRSTCSMRIPSGANIPPMYLPS